MRRKKGDCGNGRGTHVESSKRNHPAKGARKPTLVHALHNRESLAWPLRIDELKGKPVQHQSQAQDTAEGYSDPLTHSNRICSDPTCISLIQSLAQRGHTAASLFLHMLACASLTRAHFALPSPALDTVLPSRFCVCHSLARLRTLLPLTPA